MILTALDPPLTPSPDDARAALRRELADPDYYAQNLLQRALDWLGRLFDGGTSEARELPSLGWFVLTVLVLALVGGLALLLSRARLSARQREERAAVLTAERIDGARLRARALAALESGRFEEAVIDGFRALALRQVERGRLDDVPGLTAHEVARALGAEFPDRASELARGADLFDAVMYGERSATAEQARFVLGLDDVLLAAR